MKNHRKNLFPLVFLPLFLSSCVGASPAKGYKIEEVDNAGGSAFYEIFVGSFCDSNGDGIGDLKGIESKLDYLKSLGVGGLWLTPIHPSNTYHHYDVEDYYSVSPDFGTLEDFKSLVGAAHDKGMKVILDMVFNHVSNRSQWYKDWKSVVIARDKTNPMYNDFVWKTKNDPTAHDGYHVDEQLQVKIESNFSDTMVELNYDSDHVREEIANVQDFWLDAGCDGFRYDAVRYFYVQNNSGGTITPNIAKNVEVMTFLAESARAKKPDCYLIGEDWADASEIMEGYSSGMNLFYFPTSGTSTPTGVGSIHTARNYRAFGNAVVSANNAIKEKNENADLAIFVSNHDEDRWGDYHDGMKYASEQRKAMASSYLLTPGTPFIYYGEELEMTGTRGKTDMTDAMRRQAMLWGEEEITCKQPENFVVANQGGKTVKECEENDFSSLNHYRKVLSIRNKYNDVFRHGKYEMYEINGSGTGYGFKITHNGEVYYLIHNVYEDEIVATLPEGLTLLEDINTLQTAASLSSNKLTLPGYSSVLLR